MYKEHAGLLYLKELFFRIQFLKSYMYFQKKNKTKQNKKLDSPSDLENKRIKEI